MATPKKSAVDPAKIARDLRAKLGRTRSTVTRALEKLADMPEQDRVEVRKSRGGRTITVVNRGGVTVGAPRKRSR